MTTNAPKNLAELEEYDEVVQRWLDSLSPAQRMKGLVPRQRMEGLAPAQIVLGLPDEMLRALAKEYIQALPADVQEIIRRRIGRQG